MVMWSCGKVSPSLSWSWTGRGRQLERSRVEMPWKEKEVQSGSAGPSVMAKGGEALWRCREILHILTFSVWGPALELHGAEHRTLFQEYAVCYPWLCPAAKLYLLTLGKHLAQQNSVAQQNLPVPFSLSASAVPSATLAGGTDPAPERDVHCHGSRGKFPLPHAIRGSQGLLSPCLWGKGAGEKEKHCREAELPPQPLCLPCRRTSTS